MEATAVLNYFRQAAGRVDQALRLDLEEPGDPQLAEVLRYALFNGGKRIRPQLVILNWQLAGRGGGGEAEALRLKDLEVRRFGGDILFTAYPDYKWGSDS